MEPPPVEEEIIEEEEEEEEFEEGGKDVPKETVVQTPPVKTKADV